MLDQLRLELQLPIPSIWFVSFTVPIFVICTNLKTSDSSIPGMPFIDPIVDVVYVFILILIAIAMALYMCVICGGLSTFNFLARYYCYYVGTVLLFCSVIVVIFMLTLKDFEAFTERIRVSALAFRQFRNYLERGDLVSVLSAWFFLCVCLVAVCLFNFLFAVHPILTFHRVIGTGIGRLAVAYGLILMVIIPLVFVLLGIRDWVDQMASTLLVVGSGP